VLQDQPDDLRDPRRRDQAVAGRQLSSDIEAFDGTDRWAPSKENKNKNGMSVGLGFSMIKAKF
jgi:hypothetical protein